MYLPKGKVTKFFIPPPPNTQLHLEIKMTLGKSRQIYFYFYSECKIVQIEICAALINFKVDKVEKPQVAVIGYSNFRVLLL